MSETILLSEEEFAGLLRQCLKHPAEYAGVMAALRAGGFTVSEWLKVTCVEVGGKLLSVREAYAVLAADPVAHAAVSRAALAAWK